MKKLQLAIITVALVIAAQSQAALTFGFSTETWSGRFGDPSLPGDFVTLNSAPGSVTLTSGGGPVIAKINELDFLSQVSDYNITAYDVSVSQLMHLSLGGTVSDSLLQSGTLAINTSDTLTLSQGSTTSFFFPGIGTVYVTPLGLGPIINSGGDVYEGLLAQFEFSAVPEPTTIIAGAGALGLALLGIGRARRVSVVRIGG